MEAFFNVIFQNNILSTLLAISLTGLIGLYIGSIKIFNIEIGITGVLFSGIILSYLSLPFDDSLIIFIREFGLALFVYAVGMQVGNGFFSSFKKNGIFLNLFSLIIIVLNLLVLFAIKYFTNIDIPTLIGMYCGGVTNTPALATAQTALSSVASSAPVDKISIGYALTYPGAVLSIVMSMLVIKYIFKKECEDDIKQSVSINQKPEILNVSILVENKNLDGVSIKDIPAIDDLNVIISRIRKKDGTTMIAGPSTVINVGDIILGVGEEKNLEELRKIIGSKSDYDFKKQNSKIINTRAIVTNKKIIGKKIFETVIPSYNVVITRASRADVEFVVTDDYTIQFADNIVIVGEESDVLKVAKYIGNSPKELTIPNLIPIFIGLIVGVIIAVIPFRVPFVSTPLKLGLAGGLLISAIIFANLGSIGKISWYIPPSSNLMLRELGIVMFLSAVGLKSGNSFFSTLLNKEGMMIVGCGILISFLPLLITGYILKRFYKLHYLTICGFLSGSMTDPPALAFANSISESSLQSISYATVYPLTMFMRIISAQILVLWLIP